MIYWYIDCRRNRFVYFNIIFKYELIFTSWRARRCPWNKKNIWVPTKNFSPIGPAVLPAICNFIDEEKCFSVFWKDSSALIFSPPTFFFIHRKLDRSSTCSLLFLRWRFIFPLSKVYCFSADGLLFLRRRFTFRRP